MGDLVRQPPLVGEGVRDRGLMSLEQGVRRITADLADAFGLKDRGRLQAAAAARGVRVETLTTDAATEPMRMSRCLTCISSWAMTPRSSRSLNTRKMPVVAATAACCGLRPVAKALGESSLIR